MSYGTPHTYKVQLDAALARIDELEADHVNIMELVKAQNAQKALDEDRIAELETMHGPTLSAEVGRLNAVLDTCIIEIKETCNGGAWHNNPRCWAFVNKIKDDRNKGAE
jgi:hypothetical protein